jgi:predicted O-methyltransferase YrrM
VIPSLADDYYDLVYIDAMKREYLQYLLLSLPKMTPDALIIIDDVEKFRDKMLDLYQFIDKNNIKYTVYQTDVDDSIMVIQRSDILL